MFGGNAQGANNETWEWDGGAWQRLALAVSPPARTGHSLTYDSQRQRLLLFAGRTAQALANDLWEFDGTGWSALGSLGAPPGRTLHGAAYDDRRARFVVYSGVGQQPLNDLWEWDGQTWALRSLPVMPPPRTGPLVFDRQRARCLLYGGFTSQSAALEDTWEWDGSTWLQRTPTRTNGPLSGHAFAFDSVRRQIALVGGSSTTTLLRTSGLATFDGNDWRWIVEAIAMPLDARTAFDPVTGQAIAFGGRIARLAPVEHSDETFAFDGRRWRRLLPAVRPRPRELQAMVHDRARRQVLMFGGYDFVVLGDTWVWDGATWSPRATGPAPRAGAAAASDDARGRVVMHGGFAGAFLTPFADTWEWDGSRWTLLQPATPAGPLAYAAMAFDGTRRRTVMFGGVRDEFLTAVDETWEFDGTDWQRQRPATSPPPRLWHQMVFDPVRARCVLSGGFPWPYNNPPEFDDVWEWDGSNWIQVAVSPRVHQVKLVFDERRGRTLGVVDGAEVWDYRSATPPAVSAYGIGCGGARGVPTLSQAPLHYPVIGRVFAMIATGGRLAWPTFWMLGASRTRVNGLPLPIDLQAAGMPGCSLLQSGEIVSYGLANAAGNLTFGLAIPAAASLLGADAFGQTFVLDASANPAGWLASAALTITIGR